MGPGAGTGARLGLNSAPKMTPSRLSTAGARAMTAVALAYAAGTLVMLSAYWTEPAFLDDDARTHLLGFYAQRQPGAFIDRFLSDYALGYVPPGYRALLSAASQFVDPLLFSKALGAALLVTTWALAFRIGRRLGGPVGAAGGLLLAVHSGFVLLHTFGGLHRGFGFPLVLAFIWAWIERKDGMLALMVLALALTYPPMFLVCWSAFALRIMSRPRDALGPGRKGLAAQVVASLLAALILFVFSRQPDAWGPLVTIEEAAGMGEFQRDGGRIKLLPLLTVSEELSDSVERGVAGIDPGPRLVEGTVLPISLTALVFLGLTLPALGVARPRPDWAAAILLAALGVHVVARRIAFQIGEPDRALKYAVPIVIILLWPLAWGAAETVSSARARAMWRAGLILALALVFGSLGLGLGDIEPHVVDARSELDVHSAIGALEAEGEPILVAGWPDGPIENVPLLAGREVFVDYEHAHPLYLDYYAEVRRRIEETLRLIYSVDVDAARAIRDRNGLTHLIVERGTLEAEADRPGLFRPLDKLARRLDDASDPMARIFRDPPEAWISHSGARYLVIDLRALGDG